MNGMGPIHFVNAGAGTGKTWRLGTEYLNAVAKKISSARIIATTFTVKAADELTERVRGRLIDANRADDAQLVLAGLVGTVNSVCGRLVADLAIDGGLSPVADVIPPEMADIIFSVAAEAAIANHAETLNGLAERLSQEDWRKTVREIAALARSSRVPPVELQACAARSWSGLEPLLASLPPTADDETMDRDLQEALEVAIAAIEAGGDATATTKNAVDERFSPALRRLASGRPLAWSEWAGLSKVKVAKATEVLATPVIELARKHPSHPRLRRDIKTFIEGVFACAADALDHFSDYKRQRGLLDFTDQETLALDLLSRPDIRERIRERFDILMVDEFQDTSPIQLAIFLELAKAVNYSLWVGDRKQAIFGFRDTDPALVDAVLRVVRPATGGKEETLDQSRRSRPDLVRFANAVFGAAFPPKGIPADKVVIPNIHRDEPTGFGPCLYHWRLGVDNWPKALAALAGRIKAMLAEPAAMPVIDRSNGHSRPLKPSDVAVLCRSNDRCKAVADALGALGIPAAIPRDGLLETPETILAVAAFRYLVDPDDTLAVAELLHLSGESDWLADWLTLGAEEVKRRCPAIAALDDARGQLSNLTPSEALDAAIGAARLDHHVRRWKRPGERLANLDALRKVARVYEDARKAERGAATAQGLVAHFARGQENGGERPAFEGEDAIRILTYHRAKGLEWPMVILLDLQDGAKRTPFGAYSMAPDQGFDPWKPLEGRWVRFWPWPYGKHEKKNVHLDATSASSPEAVRQIEAERAELVRLLYVGVTRARDYLAFADYAKAGTGWLNILTDEAGAPVLRLPTDDRANSISVAGATFPIRVETLGVPTDSPVQTEKGGVVWYAPVSPDGQSPKFPSAWLSPSSASASPDDQTELLPPVIIGDRLPLVGRPDMAILGEAVHAFFAADDPACLLNARHSLAESVLRRWGVVGALSPDTLVKAADRLDAFIKNRWPSSRRHREIPVIGRLGDQRISGRIDLLLETADGFIIIDHKSFPGSPEQWPGKALSYVPQLTLYSSLIFQATNKPIQECLIHLPMVGVILQSALTNCDSGATS